MVNGPLKEAAGANNFQAPAAAEPTKPGLSARANPEGRIRNSAFSRNIKIKHISF
jgi:hypothetical protein